MEMKQQDSFPPSITTSIARKGANVLQVFLGFDYEYISDIPYPARIDVHCSLQGQDEEQRHS